jgi:hypothetical protein
MPVIGVEHIEIAATPSGVRTLVEEQYDVVVENHDLFHTLRTAPGVKASLEPFEDLLVAGSEQIAVFRVKCSET